MSRSPRSVRRLLKDKPSLRLLELEISAQKALLSQIRQLLPEDLARHLLAARKRDQQLVLHTDSPAWATRLRYSSAHLLDSLRADDPSLRGIRVRLMVSRQSPRRRLPPARHSNTAASIIHESALDTKQPALRAALNRLSEAIKRK